MTHPHLYGITIALATITTAISPIIGTITVSIYSLQNRQ